MTNETIQVSERAREAIPIPFDKSTIDAIAEAALAAEHREQGPPCPNCNKPVAVGQVVLPWDDAGEMHADCDHPFSLKVDRQADEPEPVVLLGEPMRQIPLSHFERDLLAGQSVGEAEAWPGRNDDLQRRRVVTLATLGLMLSKMAGGEAAEVEGFDAADLYGEVLMALAIEDADDTDIALEIARDHPEGDTLAASTPSPDRDERTSIERDCWELLRQAMNVLGTVDNNDPMEPIADNGMTVWDGMRSESKRLWPTYRALAALRSHGGIDAR